MLKKQKPVHLLRFGRVFNVNLNYKAVNVTIVRNDIAR